MADMTDTRGPENNIALVKDKQKQFNQKVQKAKVQQRQNPNGSGVVYLSHLPWGLEEKPLKEYLHQFGVIKQMRLSRSKKTGNSKGYGYVQFANDQVARIVADSMNNYLMFGKLLKCKHLANPHPKTFKNAKRRFLKPDAMEKSVARHNAAKSTEAVANSKKRALSKLKQIQKKLAALTGVEYQLACTADDELQKQNEEPEDDGEPKPKKKKKNPTVKELKSQETVAVKLTNLTPKRLKPDIPRKVDTPQGKLNVLVEDSSDDDISFKTPPFSIKSSKLTDDMTPSIPKKESTKKGTSKTPVKGQTPKKPVADSTGTPGGVSISSKTPKSARASKALKREATPVADSTGTPGGVLGKTPKSARASKALKIEATPVADSTGTPGGVLGKTPKSARASRGSKIEATPVADSTGTPGGVSGKTPKSARPSRASKVATPVADSTGTPGGVLSKTPKSARASRGSKIEATPVTDSTVTPSGFSMSGKTPKSGRPSRASKTAATPIADSTSSPDHVSTSGTPGRQLRTRPETPRKLKTPVSSSKRKR